MQMTLRRHRRGSTDRVGVCPPRSEAALAWHGFHVLDLHTHVWPHERSCPRPALALLEQYCEQARKLGVTQVAVTEHSHRFTRIQTEVLPQWNRQRLGDVADATEHVLSVEGGADLDGYVGALLDAQGRGLPILIGLEVDHLPGTTEAMARVLAEYPFDVLLGSVHWLDDWLFDAYGTPAFAQRWRERHVDDVYRDYVDAVTDLIETGMVDVLAHVDVIKVAGHRPDQPEHHEDRLFDAIVEGDVAVEFSSAGLRKEAGETYPSTRLLRRLVNARVPITTASDAHNVHQLAQDFDQLRTSLHELGITDLATFHRRTRHQVPV